MGNTQRPAIRAEGLFDVVMVTVMGTRAIYPGGLNGMCTYVYTYLCVCGGRNPNLLVGVWRTGIG